MRVAFGFVLALAIGVLYQLTDVSLPAPQVLVGASLLAARARGSR